ncbi:hypothetical protein GGR53DRAFT_526666 [Hypoxylon sp. FL1150]|nr:hypothetical protein GGR53DRAFT_526666 [Hypoxylon sp. FL1150]
MIVFIAATVITVLTLLYLLSSPQQTEMTSNTTTSRQRSSSAGVHTTNDHPLLLDRYIWNATRDSSRSDNNAAAATDDDDDNFQPKHTLSIRPILSQTRKNRILLYNGCFNPPHRGHLAHLTHAYRHGGADLDVVGAFVLVAGDQYLRWKLARSTTFLLKESQRVRLWAEELNSGGGGGAADWTWVLRENDWPRIVDRLGKLFARDGLDVEFVRLAGGDKARLGHVQHGVWGCRMTLTTDVSRPLDFYEGGREKPVRLQRHGPWTVVQEVKREEIEAPEDGGTDPCRDFMNKKRTKLAAKKAAKAKRKAVDDRNGRRVWQCSVTPFTGSSPYTLRLVTSDAADRVPPDLSSTKLRAIIANDANGLTAKQLEDMLRPMALGPRLLARYVVEEKEDEEREEREGNLPRKKPRVG